jgi:hypothetical protein
MAWAHRGREVNREKGWVAMNETIQNMLNSLANVGLRAIACVAILVVGWIICRLLGTVVDRLLAKARFNNLADRGGLRRWTGRYQPSELVGKIVYYVLLLFVFQLAFSVFGPNPISALINVVIAWLPRLIVAIVIVVVAAAIATAVYDIVKNALSQFSYGNALARIAQVVILALGAIAALTQIGVAVAVTLPVLITVLATIGGILVVGVGGGLIVPMRERWERALNRAEAEGSRYAAYRADARGGRLPGDPNGPMAGGRKERTDGMSQAAYPADAGRDIKPGATNAEQVREAATTERMPAARPDQP